MFNCRCEEKWPDMPASVKAELLGRHRLLSDVRPEMAKADVRKADEDWKAAVGQVIRSVRGELSLKEFAAAVHRDERQISRWEDGKERPHVDAVFAVERFRGPLVVALADLAGAAVEIVTEIRVKRAVNE